ncbi:MAG: glycoside hydrolase [Actinomycetota bacterium]|nr:glycoside hydrolase [Actinomycetota bacterium]
MKSAFSQRAPRSATAAVLALVLVTSIVAFGGRSFGATAEASSSSNRVRFSAPIALPASSDTGATSKTCYNPCGEPSLIQAPDGTIYVSTPRTLLVCCNNVASPVWRSDDLGAHWTNPIFPTTGVKDDGATSGGDTEMAVDKRGTLFEGDLWLGNDSIYITEDKGKTWTWSPASHDAASDREWLVYNPTDDALYGWYDGLKAGLEVIRAPLDTTAGNKTALLAPQETVAVPAGHGCVDGCPDEVNGVPILYDTESPGVPSVGPDGTVYFPFGYQVAGKGIGIAETTDGQNFTYRYVKGAGHGHAGDVDSDFPVSAVDKAGHLYVAWSEKKKSANNSEFTIYFAESSDKGKTWTHPLPVSSAVSKTAIFPTIAAGDNGRVAIGWYGTTQKGNPNKMGKHVSWDVYIATTDNAAAKSARFQLSNVDRDFHTGAICTGGLGCPGDSRKLLDFFMVGIDNKNGGAMAVYTRDFGDGGTEIAFVHQRV